MRRILAPFLRVAAAPVGVAIGLWTAQLMSYPTHCIRGGQICLDRLSLRPTFTTWQCALFGAGAAAVVLLLSFAVARLPADRTVSN